MQRECKTRGIIIGAILSASFFNALAKSPLDGYYAKLSSVCWSNGIAKPEYECGNPAEEGVSIQHIKGRSFFVDIRTIGSNGHNCWYKGIGSMKNGVIETRSPEGDCGATIKISGERADLKKIGACYGICGARATLSVSNLKKKNSKNK